MSEQIPENLQPAYESFNPPEGNESQGELDNHIIIPLENGKPQASTSTSSAKAYLVAAVALGIILGAAHHYHLPGVVQYTLLGGIGLAIVSSYIAHREHKKSERIYFGYRGIECTINGQTARLFSAYGKGRVFKEIKAIESEFKDWAKLHKKHTYETDNEIRAKLAQMHKDYNAEFALQIGETIYVASDYYAAAGKIKQDGSQGIKYLKTGIILGREALRSLNQEKLNECHQGVKSVEELEDNIRRAVLQANKLDTVTPFMVLNYEY